MKKFLIYFSQIFKEKIGVNGEKNIFSAAGEALAVFFCLGFSLEMIKKQIDNRRFFAS